MELLPPDQIAFQRMLDVIRRNYERFGSCRWKRR
jgi:histidyl-tRNA synthetase